MSPKEQQSSCQNQPQEHILACLSSSPSNAKIVLTAAKMAQAFHGTFTALYVQTPYSDKMDQESKQRIRDNIRLAEQMGATLATVYGDDVSYQIAEFARLSGVTKIVIGRSNIKRNHVWGRPSLTDRLIEIAPNLDIYIIPDSAAEKKYRERKQYFSHHIQPSAKDWAITAAILMAATGIGTVFWYFRFTESNIITIYILAVLLTSLFTKSHMCSVVSSLSGVLLFNFFFTEPRLTFHAYEPGYPFTFAIMLTAALITGTLADKLKNHAKQSAQSAFRTKVLFDTNQLLHKAGDEADILDITASQLVKLLEREIMVYPEEGGELGKGRRFGGRSGRKDGRVNVGEGSENSGSGGEGNENSGSVGEGSENSGSGGEGSENSGSVGEGSENSGSVGEGSENSGSVGEGSENSGSVDEGSENSGQSAAASKERAAAEWALKHKRRAGAATDTFADARNLYLAIRINQKVYGVVGIWIGNQPLDSFENSVILSILGECALAVENIRNAREKEQAAILAQKEQLRANLLRAISHDLRTPLTSISGNASNLIANDKQLDDETRKQMFTDIYDDSQWLINLVENLLSVTRLEEGRLNFHMTTELMEEVIEEALRHINRKGAEHHIWAEYQDGLLLARMDAKLILQVILNLVDNAIKYTPPGSDIHILTGQSGDMVMVSVADNGPGIPDAVKPKVFEMFFTGENKIADSRRSLGLGLALCKSIIHAHGGSLTLSDNLPHGCVFTFTLPLGRVDMDE